MRPITPTLCLALSCFAAETLEAAELKQETSNAFSRYIVLTEERMARSLQDGESFYSMGGKPEWQREALRIRLRQGEIVVDQTETLDGERTIKMPGGLVHHWIALGFIPGVNVNQTLALLQDYEQYPVVYRPDVKRAQLLSSDGTHFDIYLRLYQKSIVTAEFNAEFEVTYFRVDERRAHSRSYSKRIAEVENADLPKERERPVGNDRGFLWRLCSYWRIEERDGGVYVELESIGLSRSVPVIFAWLVNPLLKSIPKSYLTRVLNSTRTALTKRQLTRRLDGETVDCFETHCPSLAFKWLVWPLAIVLPINGLRERFETKALAENSTAQTAEQKKADKIKAEVAKRGVGEKVRVRVKFRDGHELKGYITQIEEDSFALQTDPDKLDRLPSKERLITISYADVAKIRGAQTRAAKIGGDVGETILFVAIVAVLIFLAIIKYNHEHDY